MGTHLIYHQLPGGDIFAVSNRFFGAFKNDHVSKLAGPIVGWLDGEFRTCGTVRLKTFS
jgi:hypothetical protein